MTNKGCSSSPALRRVPLHGYERMLTMADNASVKIAHVMLLRGSADAIAAFLRHAPHALALTFNKHPRMRAKQVRGEFAMAEMHPATVSATQIVRDKLFEVREVRERQNGSGGWQQFVERECEVPFDRYASFPFYVRAWLDPLESAVRVVLFSDHYMSDGISGLVVLNDVLAFASLLSRGTRGVYDMLIHSHLQHSDHLERLRYPGRVDHSESKPSGHSKQSERIEHLESLPLAPSLYDVWFGSRASWQAASIKWIVRLAGKFAYRQELKAFTPVIPVRADQRDFQIPVKPNSSSVLYGQGTPTNMHAATERCKRERVTFFGALAAAVVVAYYVCRQQKNDDAEDTNFRLALEFDCNMRRRVEQPLAEDTVGCYMAIPGLPRLSSDGVDMRRTRFWDLARQLKRDADEQLESVAALFPIVFLHDHVNSATTPEFVTDLPIPHSAVSDVDISSVGRYPYALEHAFRAANQSLESLRVASLHVHSTAPHLGPAACVYIASVDSLCYTLMHKHEHADAKRLLGAIVACVEGLSRVGSTESMTEVAERVRTAPSTAS